MTLTRHSTAHWPLHIGLLVGAGLCWAVTLALLPLIRRRSFDAAVVLLVALALRSPAWFAPPLHSDDVYRYVWDGRVTLAGINPYRHAPSSSQFDSLRSANDADAGGGEAAAAYRHLNNAHLPTIYPPAAQLFFVVAAVLARTGLGAIAAFKVLAAACDGGIALLLFVTLRRSGDDPRFAVAWAWSPLVAVEVAENVHVDVLALLLLVGALTAARSGRRLLAAALLGAATAAKWVTAPLLCAQPERRAVITGLAVIALTAAPFALAGPSILGSTGEFARRWRSNDGVYALVQAATDRAACRALGQREDAAIGEDHGGPRCHAPIDLWPHVFLARLVSGREERAAIYPDELSAFAARGVIAVVLLWITLFVVRRRDLLSGTEWILGALVLLTPVLHPWYLLWLLPVVAIKRRRAWIAFAALVPLAYLPLRGWLVEGIWRDPLWTRLLEHGSAWGLLAVEAATLMHARRKRASNRFAAVAAPSTLP